MKLSKEELINKINEKITDEDVAIELIEDVSDSFSVDESEKIDKSIYDELENKYIELKKKYKERFLTDNKKEEKEDEIDELEEKKVIDVKEI